MHKYQKRILVIILGILLCIVSLEVILRIVGFEYIHNLKIQRVNGHKNGEYVILCLGDSFTYGLGAPLGNSYVDYLRSLLQQKIGKNKVKVINYGFAGYNTHQLIELLRNKMDYIRPNLVIFLAGCQNLYNFYGYYEFAKRQKMSYFSSFKWLYNFKVYKLTKLLLNQLRYIDHNSKKYKNDIQFDNSKIINNKREKTLSNSSEYNRYLNTADLAFLSHSYKEAEKWYTKALTLNDMNEEVYFKIGDCYFQRFLYNKAAKWYKKGIDLNPQLSTGYIKMSDLEDQRHNWKPAMEYAKEAVKLRPNDSEGYLFLGQSLQGVGRLREAIKNYKTALELKSSQVNFIYKRIACIYQEMRQYDDALYFFTKRAKIDPQAISYMYMFQNRCNNNLIEEWIRSEIISLKKLCEDRNAILVLQNYPALREHQWISNLLKSIAKKEHCIFVDQYKFFKSIKDKESYFYLDHCNSQGYKIMAENLFDKIVKYNLIKQ